MGVFKDLTGRRFGKLTVIKRESDYVSPKGYVAVNWLCKCDCGNLTIIRGCNFKSGASQSCGCEKTVHPNRLCHGYKGTRIYEIWKGMRSRCNNPNNKSYQWYGGRGIMVCNDWNEFLKFKEWALNNGYDESLTIDRIDCNGDYEPSNCRWSDKIIQANNTRNNHLIEYNGETHTMAEWSQLTGIPYHRLKDRINKLGWDVKRALTTQ